MSVPKQHILQISNMQYDRLLLKKFTTTFIIYVSHQSGDFIPLKTISIIEHFCSLKFVIYFSTKILGNTEQNKILI